MPEFETTGDAAEDHHRSSTVSVVLVASTLLILVLSKLESSSHNHGSDCLFSFDKLLKRRQEPEYASWPKEPDKC